MTVPVRQACHDLVSPMFTFLSFLNVLFCNPVIYPRLQSTDGRRVNVNMEHCYSYNTDMENWQCEKKKNLSQHHSVHHKPHIDWSGIEPRPPCRSCDQLSEQWHGHRWLYTANNSNIWQQQNILFLALLILGTEVSCVLNFLVTARKFLYVYNP